MLKRIPAVIGVIGAFFVLGGISLASAPTAIIHASRLTSHFHFHALPHRVVTECEPTAARAVLLADHRVKLPVLLENHAHNGSVYIFERRHSTCAAIVDWTAHRERVHFTLTLLDTVTRF